jgi:hypothetical protein
MKKLESLGRSLSKDEQKRIMGGDEEEVEGEGSGCCWHTAGWTQSGCGLDKESAKAVATAYALLSGEHGYWCCASC